MDRYKVDRLENGRKIAEKYLGTKENKVEKTKSKEMPNDRLKNGKRLYEKYSGNNLMSFAREYAAQKTQRVPASAGISSKRNNQSSGVVNRKTEFQNMVDEYMKRTGGRTQTISPANVLPEQRVGGYYHTEIASDPKLSTYKEAAKEKGISSDQMAGYGMNENYSFLSPEEKNIYDYLAGKEGQKRAEEFKNRIEADVNKRMSQETADKYSGIAERNPLAGVGMNAVSAMQSGKGYAKAVEDAILGKETDPNSEAFLPNVIEEVTREGVKKKTRDTFGTGSTGDFLVDTGLSMTQNIARLPMGGLGLAIAAGGAATGGYKDALEKGGTNNQALAEGAAHGAAEAFFEKYSLEGLESMQAVPVKRARDIFKNLLKQSVTEGSEEAATELANAFSDNIIMGELSDFNQNYKRYLEMGLSKEEAVKRANIDLMKNVGLSAAGGALSGGIMGSGAMALGGIETNYENRQKNQLLIDPEDPTRGGTLKDLYLGDMAREFASMYGANNEEIKLEKQPQEPLYSPEIKPKTNNTEEYSAEDKNTVETSNTAKEVERNLAKDIFSTFGKNGMEAAADNYDGSIGMLDYQRAFGRYYDAGRHNGSMEVAEKSPITAILSKEQANAAFEAGRKDWELEQSQIPEFRQGEKKEGILIDQSKNSTRAQRQFLEKVGKNTGMKIILVDNLESGAVAEYQNGTIRISTNSKNFLGTASHEITHFIKEYGGEGYKMYRDYAVYALMESKGVSMERMIENYQKTYENHGQNLSREEVIDEIVADATEAFFNDEEFIKKVARKDHNLAEKMVDFLSDIIEAVRELISNDTRRAAKALAEDLNKLELARETWIEAMGDAGEKYKSGLELVKQGEVRFSVKELEDGTKYVEADVDQEQFDGLNTSEKLKLAEKIIMEKYRNKVIGAKPDDAYVKRESGKEYRNPARFLEENKADAKARISTELDNLMKVAEFERHYEDDGRHPDITGGWDHYKVKFKVGSEMYEGIISVGITKRGRVFKDLTKIKNIGQGDSASNIASNERRDSVGDVLNPTAGGNADQKAAGNLADSASGVSDNSIANENDTVKFQLEDPVEETKDLIAVHNITSEKLLKTLKLEGIPMPSIAVTKAELGHENFGDISLLFKKDTIDPKKKKNKVYSADAWTATFPQIDYEINDEVVWSMNQMIRNAKGKIPEDYINEAYMISGSMEDYVEQYGNEEGVIERIKEEPAMKALYLSEQGEEIKETKKEIRKEKKKSGMMEDILGVFEEDLDTLGKVPLKDLHEKYAGKIKEVIISNGRSAEDAEKMVAKEGGIIYGFKNLINRVYKYAKQQETTVETVTDYDAIKKDIESKIDDGYEDWIREKIKGIVKGSGVTNGKDIFTPSGERRTFKQTHNPVTAKNIVKAMLTQGEDAKNVSGFHGIKTLRAATADEFGSIDEIKAKSGKLQNIDYEKVTDELGNRLYNVMDEIMENENGNRLIAMDRLGENILEAAENPTVENIKSTLEKYGSIITDAQAQEIADIIQAVKEMPVNMFEAKPQRVVGYDEIAAAIVPETKADAIDALEEKGIKVITYDKSVEGARKEAVNSVEGIRFQLDEFDAYIDVEDLIEENTRLQEVNKKLSEQMVLTKKYKPRREDISKFAGEMLKKYNSSYSQKTLTDNLSRLYEHMRNTDRLDMNEVSKVAADIGRGILNKARPADTEDTKYNEKLLNTIRGTKIKVPLETKADLSVEGGYSAFKKKYFRKISLSEEGIGVDVAYEQLSGQYPDLFPESFINPTDQLFRIAEVVDEAKPKIENPYGADIDELSVVLGQELLDYRVNVRSMPPTLADKLFEKADREEERYRAARKEYEEKMRDYKKTLWERDGVKTMKKQIIRDVTKMQTWLTKPNDKEHVPEQLRTAVAKFLSCIDYSTDYTNQFGEPTKRTLEWESVQKTYEAIIASGNIVGDTYVDIDVNIADNIGILLKKVEGIERLDDLDFEGIKALRDTVTAMKKSITDVNLLHSNKKYAEAQKCGKDSFDQISKRKEKWVANGFKNVDKLLNTEMLNSFSFFERMGSVSYSVFDELRRGFDKKIEFAKITEQYFSELKEKEGLTQKDIREWGENAREFEVEGGVLKFTPAEIMSLYELTKRPQARKHIFNGLRGIRTRDVNIEKEIKVGDKKIIGIKGQGTTKPVNLSEADAQKIISTLTPQQKRVADGITKFFVDYTGTWGNEVSMLMYGYKKFNDSNYFPITVDRDEIATTSESQQQTRTLLKNLGMTKSVVRDAKNAIIIDDIFDVFARHADQMGSYSAFVPALSDFQKYYNYNDPEGGNLKTKIQEVFGKEALSYIEDLLIDINGGGNKEAGLTAGMLRNVKAAAVGASIRTVVQQPTAYMRAVVEIDPKYLAKGLKKAEKGTWEECKKYAKIAQWKDWGFFDINTGRSMRSIFMGPDSLREKAIELSMAAAGKGDKIAWTHLWMAVKEETRDLHPELKGEEFLKYCGDRFSYIIDRTQVVDSVFHRSRAMKRKGWDIYTSFMSEPTESYNMLYRAVDKLVESKQITGKFGAEEKKKLGRAVAAYAFTGLLTSIAAAVWDTARDDDDEKLLWEKYVSNLIANAFDNGNPVNMIPVAKDILSIFYGYSSNRMDLQAMQQLKYAYNELENYILGKSKFNFGGVMRKWLKPVSMLTGVPVDNAVRDLSAAFDLLINAGEEWGPEYSFTMDYKKDSITMPMSSEKNTTMYVKKALKAYSLGKKNAGDKILKELRKAGIEQNDIDSKISENIKEWSDVDDAADLFLKGDLKGYEEAVNEISSAGIDKESVIKAIRSKVDKIKRDEEEETEEEEEKEEEKEEEEEKKEEPALYRGKDIRYAIDAGNSKAAGEIIDYLYKKKRESGRSANEAKSDIKSSLTGQYKKLYLSSGHDKRREIRTKLENIRVNGTQIFSESDFTKWIDSEKKKK